MDIVTNLTFLWESWSSVSQVLSTKTAQYIERAAYARDSEVETWIKEDGLHKTPITIEAPLGAQEAEWDPVRLRAQRSFVEQNQSEEGLMMDELRKPQKGWRGTQLM